MNPLHTYPHIPSSSEDQQQQPCNHNTTHTLPKLSSPRHRYNHHRRLSFLNQLLSASFSTLLFSLFLLVLFSPQPTDSQGTSLYQQVSFAASAVLADDHFYLYGGVIQFSNSNIGTNQFLKLDLTKSFDTATTPWARLSGNLIFTMVQAAPSKDGLHFVTGGNREAYGPLSYIYSIESQTWTTTSTLPGLVSSVGYKRFNVGMALDRVTGLVYIYGGFLNAQFSNELDVLDTSASDASKMNWTLASNGTQTQALYEPFVVFLPTRNKTLVFGGCNMYNATNGLVGACFPLSNGFLISNGQTPAQLSIENRAMYNNPSPRYQSCRVVLPDGNVFIQGGKSRFDNTDTFFADAWILNVTDWTWKSVTIDGPVMEMTRAGHACQLGAYGQIVIVGGFVMKGSNSTYVTPDVAVIDTGTWKWKNSYTGGPLSNIWPSPRPELGGGSGGSNNTNDSSGLSAGAKGGIGAGVALAILVVGVAGFIFGRQRRSSSPSMPHAQKPNAWSSKLQRSGDALQKDETGFSRTINAPRGPAYISSSQPTVQALYTPPPPHTIVEAPEQSSPSMTTLSLYTGYASDEIDSTPSPVFSKKHSLFGITKTLSKSNLGGSNSNASGGGTNGGSGNAGSDAALAAALLQAEDSSTSWSPGSRKGTFSDTNDPIAFQQMTVNRVHIPSARTNQQKPQLDSYGSSSTSSSASSSDNRPPTVHTSVNNNTIHSSAATPRYLANPQSLVSEEEAKIQRFSPGVPVRTVTAQDLDQYGHYPPLTPMRGYGPSSILIRSSGSETPTTLATSPLHHSAMMTYPDTIAIGPQPLPGHPAAIEGSTRATAYFGQPAYSNGSGAITLNGDGNDNGDANGSPLYRDPQMAKDLDEIAREIESQTFLGLPKGPHSLVPSSSRKP
ncbi:hypothetical protein BGZ47_010245 [Haplosporangium gracile]|nr:hypothetical protein BGZ47_010245 [Haplosporangium gracile]